MQGKNFYDGCRSGEDRIARYRTLFPLDDQRVHVQRWYRSRTDKGPFRRVAGALTETQIAAHLDRNRDYWIATSARSAGGRTMTSFLLIDIDQDEIQPEKAWLRTKQLAEAIGPEAAPLIFRSPSGGYHVVYFLDQDYRVSEFLEPSAEGSQGLLHDIARLVLGKTGSGFCEFYPMSKRPIRWPLGRKQFLADAETGDPIPPSDIDGLLSLVERHRNQQPRLSLSTLVELRNALNGMRPSSEHLDNEISVRPVATAEDRSRIQIPLSDSARSRAIEHFRDGLTSPSTRDTVMYSLARAMVHEPDAIVPHGFDRNADPADQLVAWLERGHNGCSSEYLNRPDPAYWRDRAEYYLECARCGAGPSEPVSYLRASEWDTIFDFGWRVAHPSHRHRCELVLAGWLWKAKASAEYSRVKPDADGSYAVQISAAWRRQIPFCSSDRDEQRYRALLLADNQFRVKRRASKRARRAIEYSGFRLDYNGPHEPLGIHQQRARGFSDSRARLRFQYCAVALRRFPGDQLRERYGQAGVRYITTYGKGVGSDQPDSSVGQGVAPQPLRAA